MPRVATNRRNLGIQTFGVKDVGTAPFVFLRDMTLVKTFRNGFSDTLNANRGDIIYGTVLLGGPLNPASVKSKILLPGGATYNVIIPIAGNLKQTTEASKSGIEFKKTKYSDTGTSSTSKSGEQNSLLLANAGGLFGFAYGLWFAYKRNSSWYGYVGWALLFNTIGWAAGGAVGLTIKAFKN